MKTLSQFQQDNLRILLKGLKSLPVDYDNFNMSDFFMSGTRETKVKNVIQSECGTSACVLGHAPAFGIKPEQTDFCILTNGGYDQNFWLNYSDRITGIPREPYDDKRWRFLFGEHWGNSIVEAIARLEIFIAGDYKEKAVWLGYDLDYSKKYAK